MRRLLSILLLLVFGLPSAAPAMAAALGSDSTLPACCRRAGAHHCQGGMGPNSSADAAFRAPLMRCPYAPTLPAVGHFEASAAPGSAMVVFSEDTQDPAAAQAESAYLIARRRSHPKRGPPNTPLI